MKAKMALVLVLALLALAMMPGAAAPEADFCGPDTSYDPTCVVSHEDAVNILNAESASDQWNQSNSQTGDESPITTTRYSFFPTVGHQPSDNNHNHLGQTWTGTNNSLKIQGTFGGLDNAPLVLSNSQADGFGLRVNAPGGVGLYVGSSLLAGVWVQSTQSSGLWVDSAGDDGVHVFRASDIGVYANTGQASGQWGLYTPDRIFGSIGMFSALSLVAQVGSPGGLIPGDLVAVAGLAGPLPGSTAELPVVHLADAASASVMGVVENRLVLTSQPSQPPTGAGEASAEPNIPEVRSTDGPAQTGDYVAITILGVARAKVDSTAVIEVGQRLTASDSPGKVRALRSKNFDGMLVAEGVPVIGVALEAHTPGNDLIWVMVNPQ